MLYIWSYLKRYPKWLVLDFLGAILFVIVNLGLPTVLARMIDQGINQGDQDKLYFWAVIMLVIIVLGTFGRVVLSYAASKLTTNMLKICAMMSMLSCKSILITNMNKLVFLHWLLVLLVMPLSSCSLRNKRLSWVLSLP